MNYSFCTLFDKNYLFQGLALYRSLVTHCPKFTLYILCLDRETFDILEKLALENVCLMALKDIEGPDLLMAKQNRSHGEYCWTLGSVYTHHLLKNNSAIKMIAYLDSDLYFYSSPQPIYDEMGKNSVLIMRHNYEKSLKYLEKKSGIYNVAMTIFKNDELGLAILEKWSQACLKWCYNRLENGKFGDQMYLDNWPDKYAGVWILQNPAADVAPWNINQYKIISDNGRIFIGERPLIFYHMHTLKILSPKTFQLHSSFYKIKPALEHLIYTPYTTELTDIITQIKKIAPDFKFGFSLGEDLRAKLKQKFKRFLVAIYFSHKKYDHNEKQIT